MTTNTLKAVCSVCENSFDKTVTENRLCPEHEKLHKNGYIALVGIDPSKSILTGNKIQTKDVYRTGKILHVRRILIQKIMDMEDEAVKLSFLFAEDALLDQLHELIV